jgi:MFS family permease
MTAIQIAFYLNVILINTARGAAIITLSWVAISITGTLAAVGQVFALNHAIGFILAPAIGVLIDRVSRRWLLVLGQGLYAIAMMIPVLVGVINGSLDLFTLFCATAIGAVGLITMSGCLDAMQQTVFTMEQQRQVGAVVGGLRQAALVVGTAGAGILIHHFDGVLAFLSIALSAACGSAISIVWQPKQESVFIQNRDIWEDFRLGLRESIEHREVVRLVMLTALCFSVGQASNAVLSGFVRNEINASSDLFGIIDASWSIGGIGSALLVSIALKTHKMRNSEYICAVLLGAMTVVFSFLSNSVLLIGVFCVMGMLFSATKVLCDGRILEICPNELVGRVRGNMQSMISLLGLIIYLLPTLLGLESARVIYAVWGLLVSIGAITIFMWGRASKAL